MKQEKETPAELEVSRNKDDLNRKNNAFKQNHEVQSVLKHFNGQIDTIE